MPKRYIDKNYQKSSGPGRAGPKADSEWAGPGLDLFLSGPGRARPLTKKTGPGRAVKKTARAHLYSAQGCIWHRMWAVEEKTKM